MILIPLELYRTTSMTILVLIALCLTTITLFAASEDPQPIPRPENNRWVTLKQFSDRGLTSGDRDITIYLPRDYHTTNGRYPVIYCNDGGGFSQADTHGQGVNIEVAYDDLVERNLIRQAIIIGVAHPDRNIDLKAKKEQYYTFLAKYLKPYIDEHFRTLTDPPNTGISGISLGGNSATYLAYHHPETFGFAGCVSPGYFVDETILKTMRDDGKNKNQNQRIWICAGSVEEMFNIWRTSVDTSRILLDKGWTESDDLAYFDDYGGHHEDPWWHARIHQMLYFLLRTQEPKLIGVAIRSHDLQHPKTRVPPEPLEYDHLIKRQPSENITVQIGGKELYAVLELQYENGFRLNKIIRDFKIADPLIVSLKDDRYGQLVPHKPGTTTITGSFGKFSATTNITCTKADLSIPHSLDTHNWRVWHKPAVFFLLAPSQDC